jgi:hypothetical protein
MFSILKRNNLLASIQPIRNKFFFRGKLDHFSAAKNIVYFNKTQQLICFSTGGKPTGNTESSQTTTQRREDMRLTKMMLTIFLCFVVSSLQPVACTIKVVKS